MINVIHGEIWSEDFSKLDQLIRDFQSCRRFSYCRFFKDNMEFNDVRRIAKIKYPTLNAAQVADAVLEGRTDHKSFLTKIKALEETKTKFESRLVSKKLSKKKKERLEKKLIRAKKQLENPKLVFGGRKSWDDLKSGKITKEEWAKKRDKQIYSRGNKTRSGNQLIRILGDKLRVTIGFRTWEFYKLFIPEKFQQELKDLLASGQAYMVRLKRKDDHHFHVYIIYRTDDPVPTTGVGFENGILGIDTNPDRIAIADVSPDGNLIDSKTLVSERLPYASTDKRDHDVAILVKQVITQAKETNKGIAFENLNFDKDKTGSHKWKRKQSNFVWRKFISLLEAKCIEHGVQYKKVNPAFTSIIGKYKYRRMHRITIHESAAYVIGRRGLGFNEKLSFYKTSHERLKELILGTLAEKYQGKRIHSWRLWRELNDNIEAVLTGLQVSLADLKEFVGNTWYQGETLWSEIFRLQLFTGSGLTWMPGVPGHRRVSL